MFQLEGTSSPLLLYISGKTEAQRGAGTQASSPCSSGTRRVGARTPWPRLEHFPRRTVLRPHPEASLPVLSLWWDPVAQSELQMSPLTSPFPSTVSDSVESQPWKEPGREAARRFPELRRPPHLGTVARVGGLQAQTRGERPREDHPWARCPPPRHANEVALHSGLPREHTARGGHKAVVRVVTTTVRPHVQPATHLYLLGAFLLLSFDCEKQVVTQSVSFMGARTTSALITVKPPARTGLST